MKANQSFASAISRKSDEAEIRGIIDAIAQAVRAKDVEGMLAHCAADVVTFDLVPPLVHKGTDAIRALWADTLAGFWPPLEYDMKQQSIEVGDEVAFSYSLNQFGGMHVDGERSLHWLRTTLAFRKITGRWKVVHQHVSVPFDMRTGKALLELVP